MRLAKKNVLADEHTMETQLGEEKPDEEVDAEKAGQDDVEARIAQALMQAQRQWELVSDKRIEQARREAERMANMTAQQRLEHEQVRREAELEARERQLLARELRISAEEKLAKCGLPTALARALNCESEQALDEGIAALEKVFQEAVRRGIDEAMRGKTPERGKRVQPEAVNDDDYYKTALRK